MEPSTGFGLGDVAERLAGLGYHVFPLRPGAKTPATSSGWKAATTDRQIVRRWWDKHPAMNVGIATGPSRLVVIDLDSGKPWPGPGDQPSGVECGGDVLVMIAQELGEVGEGAWMFDVPSVRTPSGGSHLYYRLPKGAEVASSAGKVGPWVDVRARGGYVVAPWSSTPDGDYRPVYGWDVIIDADTDLTWTGDELNVSDERLRWIRFRPGQLPAWLLELVRVKPTSSTPVDPWVALERALDNPGGKGSYVTAALRGELTALADAKEGTRNHSLNRAAYNLGTLIPHLDETTIVTELTATAIAIGLAHGEASATISSGIRAGRANPRTVAV